jgi:hypothetical protein
MAETDTDLIPDEPLAPLDGEDWSQSIHAFAWFLLTMLLLLLLLGDLRFRLYRTLLALHISLVGGNLLRGSFITALIIDLHVNIVVAIDSLLLGFGRVHNVVLVFRIALIMIIMSIIIPILRTGDVILRSVIAVIVFVVFVRVASLLVTGERGDDARPIVR